MAEILKQEVQNILLNIPEATSVALLSIDGLPIVTATAKDYDDDKITLITNAFKQMTDTVSNELKIQDVNEVIIKSDDTILFISEIKKIDALLYISANIKAKLGVLLMEAQRAIEQFHKVI